MKLLCSSSCVRRCVLVGYQVQMEVFVLYTVLVYVFSFYMRAGFVFRYEVAIFIQLYSLMCVGGIPGSGGGGLALYSWLCSVFICVRVSYLDMKLLSSSSCIRRCVLVGYQVQVDVLLLCIRVGVQALYVCGYIDRKRQKG